MKEDFSKTINNDKNVYRYGEIAVKISKYTILFVIATMFKDSTIIGTLKELIF